jgi:hypothetical protein
MAPPGLGAVFICQVKPAAKHVPFAADGLEGVFRGPRIARLRRLPGVTLGIKGRRSLSVMWR